MQEQPTVVDVTTVRIPQHVVYRSLASETVVLNVQTGIYYGLNQTAGRMLEVLERVGDVEAVILELATEFEVDAEVIRQDLAGLCSDLEQKGLIEIHPA
jgi:Coenzyme PQQ synthesis protein D (PqqD)